MTSGFDRFARQTRLGGGIVPVTREVVLDGETPVTAFAKLHRGGWGFLLESLEGGERWARYTFLATEPREVFRYRGRECSRWTPEEDWTVVESGLAPLEHLGRTLRRHPPVVVPGLPRFTGGAVGFWGYDVVRTIESLPDAPPDDRDLPDATVMVADTLLVLDNLFNRATVIASVEVPAGAGTEDLHRLYAGAEARIERWLERLAQPGTMRPLAIPADPVLPRTTSPYPDARFQDDVRRIKDYIAAGDTFQTVLSRRIDLAAPDPFLAYRYLRRQAVAQNRQQAIEHQGEQRRPAAEAERRHRQGQHRHRRYGLANRGDLADQRQKIRAPAPGHHGRRTHPDQAGDAGRQCHQQHMAAEQVDEDGAAVYHCAAVRLDQAKQSIQFGQPQRRRQQQGQPQQWLPAATT
jgi:hypothetical protein